MTVKCVGYTDVAQAQIMKGCVNSRLTAEAGDLHTGSVKYSAWDRPNRSTNADQTDEIVLPCEQHVAEPA